MLTFLKVRTLLLHELQDCIVVSSVFLGCYRNQGCFNRSLERFCIGSGVSHPPLHSSVESGQALTGIPQCLNLALVILAVWTGAMEN